MRSSVKSPVSAFFIRLALAVIMGVSGGVIGSLFSAAVRSVTDLRTDNPWLIYLLPAGGLLSVLCYRLLKAEHIGTGSVLDSVNGGLEVPPALAPAVFLGTVLTHLFGGSAGREGAALQLGGGVAAALGKVFRLERDQTDLLTVCGMAAFFSALFGTPFGAFVFVLEVIGVMSVCKKTVIHTLVSSLTAYGVSCLLGTEAERMTVTEPFDPSLILPLIAVALLGGLTALLFSLCLRLSKKAYTRLFANPYLRIAVGGTLVILLTLAVGNTDYNGNGVSVIHRIYEGGEVPVYAFLLKIVFTCLTMSAGYKGGEIVPSIFVGAALGGGLAALFGISPAVAVAVGVTAVFCGMTKCPVASAVLCTEIFGLGSVVYVLIGAAAAYPVSGKKGLYRTHPSLIYKNTGLPV